MAIKQFQETETTAGGVGAIGKIFKGAPKVGNKPGQNLDYFRFEPDELHADRLNQIWGHIYGDTPISINIFFKHSNIDNIINDWFCEFGASGLKTKCDGETIVGWRDEANRIYYRNNPKPCRSPGSQKGCDKCKASALLKFCVYEFRALAGLTGNVELSTTSINDITFLRSQLEDVTKELAMAGQQLAYTPLVLSRSNRTITKTTKDRQYRGEESLLSIAIHPPYQIALDRKIRQYSYEAIGGIYEPLAIVGTTNAIAPSHSQLTLPEAIEVEVVEPWVKYWTAFLGGCDRCGTAEKLIELTDWAKKQKAYINNPDSRKMVDDKLAELAIELASEEI